MELMEILEDNHYYPLDKKCINFDQIVASDKKFAEHLRCPICIELIFNPITCNNCFCIVGFFCLNNWQKYSKTCPYGCQNFLKKNKNDPTLIKLLNIINIKCENEACPEAPTHEKYYQHLKTCGV